MLTRITLVRPHGPARGHAVLLPAHVAEIAHPWGMEATWLGDLPEPPSGLRERARLLGWDAAVVTGPLAEAPAKLIVLDVDSTFITSESIDLLAGHAGRGDEVAAITEAAMRGELAFPDALRRRVATLAGLPETVLQEVLDAIKLTPGAEELVAAAKAKGCRVGLVSGGFVQIVEPLAKRLGIDYVAANTLEVRDGRLTGAVLGEIVGRRAKERHTRRFATLAGADLSEVVAIGDGANDLDMIGAVGLGVAFCAKPIAAEQAPSTVSFRRLDAVCAYAGL